MICYLVLLNLPFKNIVRLRLISKKFNKGALNVLNSFKKLRILTDLLPIFKKNKYPFILAFRITLITKSLTTMELDPSCWLDGDKELVTVMIEKRSKTAYDLWLFLIKYCSCLEVIDAPKWFISEEDLYNLPKSLEYFCVESVFRRPRSSTQISDIKNHFPNLKIYSFIFGCYLPRIYYSPFSIHIDGFNPSSNYQRFRECFYKEYSTQEDMNTPPLPQFIRVSEPLFVEKEFFSTFPISLAQSLRGLLPHVKKMTGNLTHFNIVNLNFPTWLTLPFFFDQVMFLVS